MTHILQRPSHKFFLHPCSKGPHKAKSKMKKQVTVKLDLSSAQNGAHIVRNVGLDVNEIKLFYHPLISTRELQLVRKKLVLPIFTPPVPTLLVKRDYSLSDHHVKVVVFAFFRSIFSTRTPEGLILKNINIRRLYLLNK